MRIGLIDDVFIVNPTYAERAKSLLNIMVVGTKDGIVMVESGSKECSEEQVVDAIEFAHIEIKKICAAIDDLVKRAGKPKRQPAPVVIDQIYLDQLAAKHEEAAHDSCESKCCCWPITHTVALYRDWQDTSHPTRARTQRHFRKKMRATTR